MATGLDAGLAGRVLTITRVIDAPRVRLFRAWTDLALLIARMVGAARVLSRSITRWISGQAAHTGSVCARLRGPSTGSGGVYREIMEPERIAFTYAWEDAAGVLGHETLVTVTFEDLGSKTRLTLRQAVFDTETAHATAIGPVGPVVWSGSAEFMTSGLTF